MPSCTCPAASLACVRFADGLVLLRCSAHEEQTWIVDGRPAERDEVLPALKSRFVGCRGERRPSRRATLAPHVPCRPSPVTTSEAVPEDGQGARLTALLHARGLSGTWAIA